MTSINILKAAVLHVDGLNTPDRIALVHNFIEAEVQCRDGQGKNYRSTLMDVCTEVWSIVLRTQEARANAQFEVWQNREEAYSLGEI